MKLPRALYAHLYFPFLYHPGNAKSIFLFSSRRGGSTYLEQIISANVGIRSIDQPFDLFRPQTTPGKLKSRYLPAVPHSQFISLSASELSLVKEYVSLILQGKLRLLGGVEKPGFPVIANRTLLKIVSASPLIDWFEKQFSVYTCHLLRHPIAQSLSVMRNNWGITADAYINSEFFIDSYMNSKQVDFAKRIILQGSYFQKAILNWCLENLVPLKYANSITFRITYEELIMNPKDILSLTAKKLDLPDIQSMSKSLNQPSRSARFSSRSKVSAIQQGNRTELLAQWPKKVSQEQITQANKILEMLEIGQYNAASILPNRSLLHFPDSIPRVS